MPTPDGQVENYKFTDFGLYYPTLTAEVKPYEDFVQFFFETNTMEESSEGEGMAPAGPLVSNVERYDFIIQMAWIPRSPIERQELKQIRVEAEEAAKAKEEAEAAKNEDN